MKKIMVLLIAVSVVGCTSNPLGMFGAPTVNITVNMGSNDGTSDPNNPQVNSSVNTVGEGAIQVQIEDGGFGEGAEVMTDPKSKDKNTEVDGTESIDDSPVEDDAIVPVPDDPVAPGAGTDA